MSPAANQLAALRRDGFVVIPNAPLLINDTATFTDQTFAVGNGQIIVIDAVLPVP